jgi:NitT/TauT family transport system substrate-binding protein
LAILVLICPVAGQAEATRPPRKATVVLQWVPQSQFAGFYVAQDKGFYLRRGLDVTIRHGGPEMNSIDALADGSAEFATTFLTSALHRRDSGLPLVNIAQIVNRSTAMLVARKGSGIRSIEDLNGRNISIWSGDFGVPFEAVLSSRHITPARRFTQNYSVNLFLKGGVDACAAMHYNEYHMLSQAGLDEEQLVAFPLSAYGCSVPEDGIYVLERTWKADPAFCRAFAEATMEGWLHARNHPDEALQIVMRRVIPARIPTNRSHMQWMLEKILPGIIPGPADGWKAGLLSRREYAKAVELMIRQGLIRMAPPYGDFHPVGGNHVP